MPKVDRFFKKRPITVKAWQWEGGTKQDDVPEWVLANCSSYKIAANDTVVKLEIQTLEGPLNAKLTDFIIEGVNGEVYPCDWEVFKKSYDEVTL